MANNYKKTPMKLDEELDHEPVEEKHMRQRRKVLNLVKSGTLD